MTDVLTVSVETLNVNVINSDVHTLEIVEQDPDVLNISEVTETVTVLNDNVATLTIQTEEPDNLSVLEEITTVTTIVTAGPQGPPGDGSAAFVEPDLVDDTDATYFYFGWTLEDTSWLIQRQDRSTSASLDATTGYPDLATAWPNRDSLTYV